VLNWGIHIDRVEIKDVALPDAMKRSMSRQAEAERERRARVITADGELQASHKLAQAAATMADTPTALQLRLLETVVEVAAEKNSTLVLPFPVELLRFLEKHPTADSPPEATIPYQPPTAQGPATTEVSAGTEGSAAVESRPERRVRGDIGAVEPAAAARKLNGQPA
jgi:hypothetical protein